VIEPDIPGIEGFGDSERLRPDLATVKEQQRSTKWMCLKSMVPERLLRFKGPIAVDARVDSRAVSPFAETDRFMKLDVAGVPESHLDSSTSGGLCASGAT
jgi:hypothetical protein